MKNNGKSALLQNAAGSLCLIVAGLVLLVNPDFGSAAVATIIGWVLIAAAGLGILVSVLSWPVFGVIEMILCVLGLGLGVYLVTNPLSLASILGLGLGAYLAIQGLGTLLDALRLKRRGYSYTTNLVLAIAMLGLGLFLIISPLSSSRLIMTVCGIAMLVCGVVNLLVRARTLKRLQDGKTRQTIIDAED